MQWQDLFVHVYWGPAVFWSAAFALAALDIAGTWAVGRAVRISGPSGGHSRPWLSWRRRVWIEAAILATFPLLSVLRGAGHPTGALIWFFSSQFVIALVSVGPVLRRALATLREVRRGGTRRVATDRGLRPARGCALQGGIES
ncbi:MAG: hypothetical protein ACYCT1_13610 [Steroidobacteraceae bacterium]